MRKLILLSTLITTLILPLAANAQMFDFADNNPARNFTNPNGLIPELLGGNSSQQFGLIAYAIVFSGLILLFMLISGGFTMLTNPTNPQAQEAGKNRITYAVAGFLVVFSAFWIIQALEIAFDLEVVRDPGSGGGSEIDSGESTDDPVLMP